VGEHSLADREGRSQVLAEELLLWVRLQRANKLTVNLDLILLALLRDNVGGLLLLEDFAFAMTDLLGLGAAEVVVVEGVGDLDPRKVDLRLGGNDVDLVDSSEGASVDAERSGDEQKSRGQLLQEDDTLALVGAGQQDQDGAGSDGRTQLAVVLTEGLLVVRLSLFAALRGQSAGHLVELNDALLAVLLTTDLLDDGCRLLGDGSLLSLLVLDEGGLLVVHLGSGESHDSSVDLNVASSVSHGQQSLPNVFLTKMFFKILTL